MIEPEIDYCTIRDAVDEKGVETIHLECRFKDGQKFAAVEIAGGFDNLAEKIMHFLNGTTPE